MYCFKIVNNSDIAAYILSWCQEMTEMSKHNTLFSPKRMNALVTTIYNMKRKYKELW